jgi:hypothetical protein
VTCVEDPTGSPPKVATACEANIATAKAIRGEDTKRNLKHAKLQSSSETTLGLFLRAARARCSFLLGGLREKHPSRTSEEKKREVFTLRFPYSCTQRPKTRDLSPAATSTASASCSGPLEPDTGIFPGGPISGIQASPQSVLASICAGSKACNKGPERSCIEFVGPEKTRRRSDLRRRSYRFSAKGGNCL